MKRILILSLLGIVLQCNTYASQVWETIYNSTSTKPTSIDIHMSATGAFNVGTSTAPGDVTISLRGDGWISGDGDAEGIYIDSDGDIGIGQNTLLSVTDRLTMNFSAGESTIGLNTYNGSTNYSRFRFRRSGSNSLGVLSASLNGHGFGDIEFYGVNSGSSWAESAIIKVTQKGAAGATYVPSQMQFGTSSDSGLNSNQLVLQSDARVGIGTLTPAYGLDVSTNVGISGDAIITGSATVAGLDVAGWINEGGGAKGLNVTPGGNVGINESDAESLLEVNADTGSNSEIALSDDDVSQPFTTVAGVNVAMLFTNGSTAGGGVINGMSDTDAIGVSITGHVGSVTVTDTAISLVGKKWSGAGSTRVDLADDEVVLSVDNNSITDILNVYGNGDAIFGGTVTAKGFIQTCKFPKDGVDPFTLISGMKAEDGTDELDHSTLSSEIKRNWLEKKNRWKNTKTDKYVFELPKSTATLQDYNYEPESIQKTGQDIGLTLNTAVACINSLKKTIDELRSRIEILEK